MKTHKTSIVIISLLLIATAGAAGTNFDSAGQQNKGDFDDFQATNKSNFFSDVINSLLSITATEDVVRPGESTAYNFELSTNKDVLAENLDVNIDVIYCGDECTDPPKGSCFEIGDVAEGEEDCIAHIVQDWPFSGSIEAGSTVGSGSITYNVPSDAPEGRYLVQGFLYDRVNEEIVSDFNNDYFRVESEDTSEPEPEPEPEVVAYQEPDVTVGNGKVTGTVYFENTGGDMDRTNIVEMQIKTPQNEFLAFLGSQDTCDPTQPRVVNREYRLESGERKSITLESDVSGLEDGRYDVVFVTATECIVNGDGELTQPYSAWDDNYRETVTVGTPSEGGTDDGSDTGIPVNPVFLFMIAIGGLLLVGYVYSLWVEG